MEASLRNTPALTSRIEKLRDDMLKRFGAIVALAGASNADRNATAITQYQIQVETAALITAAEDAQSLIRQLQEMWLFGQLNPLGSSKAQQQTNEDAKAIAALLKQLTELQQQPQVNGATEPADAPAIMTNGA